MMWIQSFMFAIVATVSNSRVIRNSPITVNKYASFQDYKTPDFKDVFYWRNLQRELNNWHWLNTLYQPTHVFKYPFGKPTSDLFANEPAPEIKYPFKVGIVDPRTVDKSGSSNTNRVDIKPSLATSVGNARAPIIRYPFKVGIVDPRTVMKPTSRNAFDNEPAPDIKHRF